MSKNVLIACLAFAAFLAGLVTTSRLAILPDSDSLLLSIISLQRPTFYYWAQNRLGGLLPMLSSPVGNIEVNFVLQSFCRALAAALTPAFLIVILRPRIPHLLSFAASLGLIFVVATDVSLKAYWLDAGPYAVSLLFCTMSAWLVLSRPGLPRWRLGGAILFALVASWINIGIFVVSAPLFAIMTVAQRSRKYVVLFVISLVCFVFESLHSRRFAPTNYHGFAISPYEQIAGLRSALQASIEPTALVVAVLLLVLLLVVLPARRAEASRLGLLLSACTISVLITAATTWFMINGYHPRYVVMPLMLSIGGVGIWIAQLVYEALNNPMRRVAAPAMALAAAALCVDAVRPYLPLVLIGSPATTLADRAVRADAHLIAGDYWTTWPTVFESIRLRRANDTFGLTSRGEVMIQEVRALLARNPRVLCVTSAPDGCRKTIAFFVGSDFYNDKPLAEALNAIETQADPYSVLYELR